MKKTYLTFGLLLLICNTACTQREYYYRSTQTYHPEYPAYQSNYSAPRQKSLMELQGNYTLGTTYFEDGILYDLDGYPVTGILIREVTIDGDYFYIKHQYEKGIQTENIDMQIETQEGTSWNIHRIDENGKMYGTIPYKGTTVEITTFVDENDYLITEITDPFTKEIIEETFNENDERIRKKVYYPDGKLHFDFRYKDKLLDGWTNLYDKEGRKKIEILLEEDRAIMGYYYTRFGNKRKLNSKELSYINNEIKKNGRRVNNE